MRTTHLLFPLSLLLTSCGMTAVNPGDDAATGDGGCSCPSGPHSTPTCNAGACGLTCDPHFADCDKNPQNGCEADTSSDGLNCGTCGKGCGAVANGTPSCKLGTCSAVCNVGFADCDNSFANGCETNTNTDKANCGSCANSCGALANAQTACSNGACTILGCDAGHADCDNKPLDGCEVTLADDPVNCGGCAKSCPMYANSTPVCMNGGCSRGPCAMGFDDCDNLPMNGCETSVASDLANCGACSKVCSAPHGTPQCMAGACSIAACSQGYADCDQLVPTGCETQTATDVANCGGCGKACPVPANATPSCSNSVCGAACNFGFGNCDNNLNNGCEAPLATDLSNCGQCGMVCGALPNASPGCSAGTCGVGMCQNLFGNCDGNPQNGCEKSLAADPANCGACGKACNFQNGQGTCLNGLCGLSSCNNGFSNCDNNAANGCEVDLQTDANNCGMCAKVCPQNMNVCVSSMCTDAPVNPFFNSMPGASSGSTARGAGAACGTYLIANQAHQVVAIAANISLAQQANCKFIIFSHPAHQLVFSSPPKLFPAGPKGWFQSNPIAPFTMQMGQEYDVAATCDAGVTYYYDQQVDNVNGIQSFSQNGNWTDYNNPTFSGHAGVDCGIQLF